MSGKIPFGESSPRFTNFRTFTMLIFWIYGFSIIPNSILCSENDKALAVWRQVFKKKRQDQLEIAGHLLFAGDRKKQSQTLTLLTEASKKVLLDAKSFIELSNFEIGHPFPLDSQVQEHFSRIMENTAFLCEISLRLPNPMRKILKKDENLHNLLSKMTNFALETGFFEQETSKIVDLCQQELYFKPRRLDFRNIYEEKEDLEEEKKEISKKIKAKKPKGPRLSGRKTEF